MVLETDQEILGHIDFEQFTEVDSDKVDTGEVEDNLENALKDATIVFIANNDEIFKKLTPEQLLLNKQEVKVVDFWRCLSSDFETHPKIKYIPIGKYDNCQTGKEKLEDLWG